jgi:hypothetical protein
MEMSTTLMPVPPDHHVEPATDLSITNTTSGPEPELALLDPAAARPPLRVPHFVELLQRLACLQQLRFRLRVWIALHFLLQTNQPVNQPLALGAPVVITHLIPP